MDPSRSKPHGKGKHGLRGCVGIALGSGAARGWAHIGVLAALREASIEPSVICGASIGAVVGAAYAAQRLPEFTRWALQLNRRSVVGQLDPSFRGGLLKANKVFEFMSAALPNQAVEELPRTFAAVATDLHSGQEVWLRSGTLFDVLRASIAIPGLLTPVLREGRWLLDGGLVNPVPISLCRALGADSVIAVDLNTTLLGRHRRAASHPPLPAAPAHGNEEGSGLHAVFDEIVHDIRRRFARDDERDEPPSLFEVMGGGINIMQVRITRSRMAGDPPELLIAPRLADFALFDFDRAEEAIEEGRRATVQALAGAV